MVIEDGPLFHEVALLVADILVDLTEYLREWIVKLWQEQ